MLERHGVNGEFTRITDKIDNLLNVDAVKDTWILISLGRLIKARHASLALLFARRLLWDNRSLVDGIMATHCHAFKQTFMRGCIQGWGNNQPLEAKIMHEVVHFTERNVRDTLVSSTAYGEMGLMPFFQLLMLR